MCCLIDIHNTLIIKRSHLLFDKRLSSGHIYEIWGISNNHTIKVNNDWGIHIVLSKWVLNVVFPIGCGNMIHLTITIRQLVNSLVSKNSCNSNLDNSTLITCIIPQKNKNYIFGSDKLSKGCPLKKNKKWNWSTNYIALCSINIIVYNESQGKVYHLTHNYLDFVQYI